MQRTKTILKNALLAGILLLAACNPEGDTGAGHEMPAADTSQAYTPPGSLKEQLDAKREDFLKKAPKEKIESYQKAIDSLAQSSMMQTARAVGDKAPAFTLTNALGKRVSLEEYLKKGPVVLTWYRGGWCPYCNLYMHAMQDKLPEMKAQGASLLALTPELPDKSLDTKEKHAIEFEVLSDVNNEVARQFGIVFKLTPDVAAQYNESFDLKDYNGNNSNELPLAAAYIINTDGTIRWAFLDADYRNRAEPAEIVAQLKKLRSEKAE